MIGALIRKDLHLLRRKKCSTCSSASLPAPVCVAFLRAGGYIWHSGNSEFISGHLSATHRFGPQQYCGSREPHVVH